MLAAVIPRPDVGNAGRLITTCLLWQRKCGVEWTTTDHVVLQDISTLHTLLTGAHSNSIGGAESIDDGRAGASQDKNSAPG